MKTGMLLLNPLSEQIKNTRHGIIVFTNEIRMISKNAIMIRKQGVYKGCK